MKSRPIKFNEFPEQCQHCSNLRCFSLYMSGNHDYTCCYHALYLSKGLECPHYNNRKETESND